MTPPSRTPPVMRDPSLPHQIILGWIYGETRQMYVSCNCIQFPLAIRTRWADGEPQAIWQAHMAEVAGTG